MRVLHLYAGNLFGGIERTLLTLWRARAAAPHMQPHFGLCFDGKLARELRANDAPLEIFGGVRLSRPWTAWRARRRLREFFRRDPFDVVVAHSLWPHVVFAPAVRRAGVPMVTWLHDVPRRGGWLERFAGRTPAELMLANSHYTASEAAKVFAGAHVEVQYPPVELPARHDRSARESLGTSPDKFVVLIASRLQPMKGHAILIDTLAMLPAELDWECWIAGDARRARERRFLDLLRERARAVRVDARVRFLGHRDDVPRLLAAADVLCQPNLKPEGFGLAFVEAMAAGVPVITTDLGAARELVDESGGVLVPPNDARATAAALVRYFNVLKNTRLENLSRGKRRAHEMWGAERALPRLAAILERVRAGHAAPA